ncbi:hypothetical protein [Anaeroselena agilis]|uniref:Uncharacterized protein n=1 Tax=Anaeroselena agilis TaxID=3063788 RepID=A0ABU3NVG8_9FIRM|nr:hypothetical protein [Selenomonadales bacterium 4137-cl]
MFPLLRHTKILTLLMLFAFLALVAGVPGTATVAQAAGIVVIENSPEASLANLIFRILDIPVTVYEINDLKTTRSMGHGEIALAYSLAHASGYPVSHILHLRFDEKMGWGKIAKTLGVKLRSAAAKSDMILRDGNFNKDADELKIKVGFDIEEEDKPGNHKKADNDDKNNKPGKPGKNNGKNK